MVILDVDHPDVIDFIDSKALEEKKAWALIEQGYDPSFTGEAYGSVFFQNANHSVRVTDDFMRAVEQDGDWTTIEVSDKQPAGTYKAREIFRKMADAAHLCGDPGHPVRLDHQRLAHERELGPHLRVQPVLGVHVPQRHGVQPGQPQPDEVRPAGRRVRRRGVPVRGQGHDHGAGDPRRQRELPDAEDRGEQPPLPAAGPGLREPRRAADEPRPRLRLGRGPQLRRRDHRADARRGLPPELGHRPRPRRLVRRLRHEPRPVPAGHRQAPRRGLPAARGRRPPADAGERPPALRRRPGAGRGQRLPQRAGHRARAHRHDRVHDGLRYHRHRARHRAHQVQEARRRGLPQDRQPDGPGGAPEARLRRRRRSRRSSPTSTSRRRSRARPASSPSTCPSSTARSSRSTASGPSTTWATSG